MSIIVKNLVKTYGEQKALDNISFEIKDGEIAGFIGPNGAGKSTTMKILTGFIPATSGQAFVNGLNINKNDLEVRKIVGYLPEHNPLYLDMYIREFLSFVARTHKIKPTKKIIDKIIEMTGLEAEMHKKIGALSKGYRQRVGLAQALIHDPKVLILDEPTTGLDPNQIVEIRNLISEIGKSKTVMLSTHIMQEVEAICDRIIIINKGKIVADKTKDTIVETIEDKNLTFVVEFETDISDKELLKIESVSNVKAVSGNIFIITSSEDIRKKIFNFGVEKNIAILSMQQKQKSLEEIFHELTK